MDALLSLLSLLPIVAVFGLLAELTGADSRDGFSPEGRSTTWFR